MTFIRITHNLLQHNRKPMPVCHMMVRTRGWAQHSSCLFTLCASFQMYKKKTQKSAKCWGTSPWHPCSDPPVLHWSLNPLLFSSSCIKLSYCSKSSSLPPFQHNKYIYIHIYIFCLSTFLSCIPLDNLDIKHNFVPPPLHPSFLKAGRDNKPSSHLVTSIILPKLCTVNHPHWYSQTPYPNSILYFTKMVWTISQKKGYGFFSFVWSVCKFLAVFSCFGTHFEICSLCI